MIRCGTVSLVVLVAAASSSPGVPREEFKPAVIRFGASVAEMQRDLAGACSAITTRQITPPFRVLRDLKDRQFQIDCDGFVFQGKPRWTEFVIADDALEMVWILTDSSDEPSFRKLMAAEYGASDLRNAKFAAFTKGRAALRTDRPEVLFYSERMAPRVLDWFGPNSTF